MIEIPLTQGKKTIIDEADVSLVARFTWCAHENYPGHWVAESGGSILMHRLLTGASPDQMVDHRNEDSLDNRRQNLRICSNAQNQQNTGPRGGSSKYKGVSWYGRRGKWRVAFNWNGETHFIGYFENEDEAALAYNSAVLPLAGEFARLNDLAA